jgi:zinc transport system substrate-binding protein
VLVVAGVLASCGDGGSNGAPSGGVRVVATFFPLAEVARRVGGDVVTVDDLTPAGVEPHDLELTTGQVDELLDADVVVYAGGGFQPAVSDVVDRRDAPTIDVLDVLDAGAAADAHVWLDPVLMVDVVEQIRAALTDAAPDHADTFAAGARAFVAELEQLHLDYEAGLASCARRDIVTAHAAFGHLVRRYDLVEHSLAGSSPEAEPDAAQLAQLADLISGRGITTVFGEALGHPEVAEALAGEAGVEVVVLDPVEGLTDDAPPGTTYLDLMTSNLVALQEALDCRP